MALVQHGKFEDIIYARFDPGADLMLSLHEVCKQEGVITGLVPDLTGTNAEATACGHLLEGSMILGGDGSPSHFTVVIAKVTGLKLRAVWEETEEKGTAFWHELTPA